ncbi:CMRF35-like molecule 8 [Scleropages formosus]|uniref:CMRF35-like molecule 8 n=1 Tax=Scleropages formosus TaxID=113540 RepID=UPI000878ED41|nr:CMRF35-like molecule 8 [Scleropages formosus]
MRVNKGHVKVSAQVGHSVNITCPYNILSRQSQKSWCRGKLYDSCKTMVSTLGPMTNGRVSIWDDPSNGAFHVTMSALTEKDAGWYQCVKSGFLQPQTFSHVYLNVTKGFVPPPPREVTTSKTLTTHSPWTAAPIASEPSIVWDVLRWILFALMLACIIVITCWKRAPAILTASSGRTVTSKHMNSFQTVTTVLPSTAWSYTAACSEA